MLVKLDISFSKDGDDKTIPLVAKEVPGFIAKMEKQLGKKVHSWKLRNEVIKITLDDKLAADFFELLVKEWTLKLKGKDGH